MAGTLSIVVNGTINGFGVPYNGAGSLYGAVKAQKTTTVTYSGNGALSGDLDFQYLRSVSLSGSGTLVGDLDQKYFMQYQEASDGTLAATTTSRYYQVKTMALSGGGTLAATAIQPAVLFDNSVTVGTPSSIYGSGGKTHTWNHVAASDASVIFVAVLNSSTIGPTTIAVNCNGNPMFLATSVMNGTDSRLYIYYTGNFIQGASNSMSVAFGCSVAQYLVAASTSFINVSQLGSSSLRRAGASTTNNPSLTCTTFANGGLYSVLGFRNTSTASTTGFANDYILGSGVNGVYFADQQRSGANATADSTNVSVSATISAAVPWVMASIPLIR